MENKELVWYLPPSHCSLSLHVILRATGTFSVKWFSVKNIVSFTSSMLSRNLVIPRTFSIRKFLRFRVVFLVTSRERLKLNSVSWNSFKNGFVSIPVWNEAKFHIFWSCEEELSFPSQYHSQVSTHPFLPPTPLSVLPIHIIQYCHFFCVYTVPSPRNPVFSWSLRTVPINMIK